jgi:hypothetical protein
MGAHEQLKRRHLDSTWGMGEQALPDFVRE